MAHDPAPLIATRLAAGELARRAELGRTSIYPALESLERAGIVTFLGAGAQRQIAFRASHPLARVIVGLFRAEQQKLDNMLAALGKIADSLRPRPVGVWIEGLLEPPGDVVSCWILGDPKSLTQVTDAFSQQLGSIEREYDVHIDVHGTTRSELAVRVAPERGAVLDNAVVLAGVIPRSVTDADEVRSTAHGEHASPEERRELLEWERILTMSPARLQRFLADPREIERER